MVITKSPRREQGNERVALPALRARQEREAAQRKRENRGGSPSISAERKRPELDSGSRALTGCYSAAAPCARVKPTVDCSPARTVTCCVSTTVWPLRIISARRV